MSHQAVHAELLAAAEPLSPALHAALARLGPLDFPRRDSLPFPEYLCRAIAGQQISVKAAQAIWSRVEASAEGRALLDHFTGDSFDTLRGCGAGRLSVRDGGRDWAAGWLRLGWDRDGRLCEDEERCGETSGRWGERLECWGSRWLRPAPGRSSP